MNLQRETSGFCIDSEIPQQIAPFGCNTETGSRSKTGHLPSLSHSFNPTRIFVHQRFCPFPTAQINFAPNYSFTLNGMLNGFCVTASFAWALLALTYMPNVPNRIPIIFKIHPMVKACISFYSNITAKSET